MKALNVKQVCEKLSLSRTTIYRMIAAGVFPKPFVLYGNRTAWLEEDVDAWLAKPAGKVAPDSRTETMKPTTVARRNHTQGAPPFVSDIERLLPRIEVLIALLSRPETEIADRLWGADEIAEWMRLSPSTIKQRVICQPGFPKPFQPGGLEHSQSRWFASEIIKWAREHRGTLPVARPRIKGKPG